jgi:hypothetical protein
MHEDAAALATAGIEQGMAAQKGKRKVSAAGVRRQVNVRHGSKCESVGIAIESGHSPWQVCPAPPSTPAVHVNDGPLCAKPLQRTTNRTHQDVVSSGQSDSAHGTQHKQCNTQTQDSKQPAPMRARHIKELTFGTGCRTIHRSCCTCWRPSWRGGWRRRCRTRL